LVAPFEVFLLEAGLFEVAPFEACLFEACLFEGGLFEGARLSDVLLPLAQLLTYAVDAHAPNQRVAPLAYTTTACDHSFLERVIPRP
jgi:hypothetical protein